MKRTVISLSVFLIMGILTGQSIDSVHVYEWNNHINIEIKGTNPSSGEYISNVVSEVQENEINIDLFFIHCAGFGSLTPYETIIDLGILPPQDYLITCRTINDTFPGSTNCFPNYEFSTIDSLSFYYYLLRIENGTINKNEISIYPNPFNDFIIVEGKNLNHEFSIVITDLNGKVIKDFQSVFTKERIDLINIKQGIYIIKILTPKNKEISKKIIKIEK